MVPLLFRWLFVVILSTGTNPVHPIYMSVTEIDHNAKEGTLEISCKLYTDDFEQTLRKTTRQKIDLLEPKQKNAMNNIVSDYVQQHLKINAEGKPLKLNFLGYEQIEEGIVSYFQVKGIRSVKELRISDNILYEYKSEQISLLHVTVNGTRQSTKLNNPEDKVVFRF